MAKTKLFLPRLLKYRFPLILLLILVLIVLILDFQVEDVFAAEGDLLWTRIKSPNDPPISLQETPTGAITDDTGLYVAGYVKQTTGWPDCKIEKRDLGDGSLIWSKTINIPGAYERGDCIAVDAGGIYVGGVAKVTTDAEWKMEKRSLVDGSLIWSKTSNPGSVFFGDMVTAVAVSSTAVYFVGLHSITSSNSQWRIEKRSLDTGNIIWTKSINPSSGRDQPYGVAVDDTGIYVVGADSIPGNSQWRIEKRSLSSGSSIWSKTNNPSSGVDSAGRIAIDSTGIYLAGNDLALGAPNSRWRIEKRSLTNGNLIWTETSNPSSGNDMARGGIGVNSAGVYIAGTSSAPGNYRWRIEKRDLTDGSLEWFKTTNPSSNSDEPTFLALATEGIFIVGYDLVLGGTANRWRIEKRELPLLAYIDIGLRVYDEDAGPIAIAAWPLGQEANSPLRIAKDTDGDTVPEVYGIALVDPGDPNDSGVRIKTGSGAIKALRKL